MTPSQRKPQKPRGRRACLGIAAAALLVLGLLTASPASAAYEQVSTFAGNPGELHPGTSPTEWPEEVQLSGVGGMAVNYTGAGGVPAGTLYAATFFGDDHNGGAIRVARFNPDGSFSENWTFNEDPKYKERCGPDGEPAHPMCKSRVQGNSYTIDVEVDQSTGYVYALDAAGLTDDLVAGMNTIHVYSADGSELIGEFGVFAKVGETLESSPEKVHSAGRGGLALGLGGKVYVFDVVSLEGGGESIRLMTFEPQSPGDYEHYVYAGQAHDVPMIGTSPVADAAGDIYARKLDGIVKIDPDQPADPPLCEFKFPKGHIYGITVNQLNGEVFFYTDTDKKIHQLSSCNGTGKFKEVGTSAFSPPRFALYALAFDPISQFEPSRPAGVLYGAAADSEGGKTEEGPPLKIESSLGYTFAPPAEFPPEVLSESVSHVTATTAELGAQINPKGPPTDYVFQYLTQAEYEANEPADRFAGAKEAPPGGGLVGEGPKALSVVAPVLGLEPDTAYRYRVVATSHCSAALPEKVCETKGAEQSFRTFPAESPGLPDGRVYELVSPAVKGGGQVLPADSRVFSCAATCKPGELLDRFPMQSSPDGETIVYEGLPFSEGGALRENEYIAHRDPSVGWQTTTLAPALLEHGVTYKAFDTELTRGVIRQQSPALSPEAPAGFQNLYTQPTVDPLALSPLMRAEPPHRLISGNNEFKLTYAGASADLSRVFFTANDALTFETPFAPEAVDGGATKSNLYEWEPATEQLRLVNVLPENATTQAGASFGLDSANTISDDGSRAFWSSEAGQLYVREGAEATKAIPDAGKFLAAATDGSKVLLTNGHLYDLEEEAITDLTEGKGGFQGIAGQSDDLSHVYFVDTEVLNGEEENSEGDKAEAGKFNLYAWEEGSSRYVATLVSLDSGSGFGNAWAPSPSQRTAEASPHGRYLAFSSRAQLTGYENTGPCGQDEKTFPCSEAFLYDSATGELTCPSCNPTGVPPLGNSTLRLMQAGVTLFSQPRYLTDEGRLYFDSRDSLSVNDTNDGVEDVYEYEPNEVGDCKRAAGCLRLVSAGREPVDSNFLAMDEDGSNVFFTTRDQLVLKDHDDLIDLYVAREGGGIPAETEVARSECQGEACVAAYSPPNDPTPGSSSFEGAGNVDEKKTNKKHKKKKHAKKKHAHKRAAKHNRGGAK